MKGTRENSGGHGTRLGHYLGPVLVDLGELLRLLRKLLGDVAAGEDGLQGAPHHLHLDPALEGVRRLGQGAEELLGDLPERRHVAHGEDGLEVHLGLLELLDDHRSRLEDVHAAVLPLREEELLGPPLALDLAQLALDLELLVGAVGDLLDLLPVGHQVGLEERLELELGVADHVEVGVADLHDLVPVARLDRVLRELLEQGEDGLEVLDLGPQLGEALVVPELARELLEPSRVGLHRVAHLRNARRDRLPRRQLPLVDRVDDVDVQVEEQRRELDVLLDALEAGVVLVPQGEQHLAAVVEVELPLPYPGLLAEAGQPVHGLHRGQSLDERPVLHEVRAERLHVLPELGDVPREGALEPDLRLGQLVRAGQRLLDQLLPVRPEDGLLVDLLLLHEARRQVVLEHVVHVHQGVDLHVYRALPLPDLAQDAHHEPERVQVLDLSRQLPLRDARVLRDRLELELRAGVEVLGVLERPPVAVLAEVDLQVPRVEGQGADDVYRAHALDVPLDRPEVGQLDLVVLQGRVCPVELVVRGVLVVPPEPVVLLERVEVLRDRVADALDAAREEEGDLDELDVLGDAVEEGVAGALLPGKRRVAPVDDLLVAGQHGLGRLVDALLDLVEGGRQGNVRGDELDVDLEERPRGVEDVRALARADPLLERVHRVLGREQQGLVHEVVVVLAQLRGVPLGDALDLGLEVVRRDLVDQVVHGVLYLHVLALEQPRLAGYVRLLHDDELRHRERRVLGQVHEQRLRDDLEVLLDPVLDDVVDARHELLEPLEAGVDVVDVWVDVERRPRQGRHAGTELPLHVLEVRAQHHRRDGDDLADDAVVLLQGPVELPEEVLELLLLQKRDLCSGFRFSQAYRSLNRRAHNVSRTLTGALGNLDAHAIEALGLADQLEYVAVEVHVELVVVGVA